MTHPLMTLDGVAYRLPDGRELFSNLSESFDRRPTGLVGRNGVGKTVLARILAGQLAPCAGRRVLTGTVHLLAQQVGAPPEGQTVAALAGLQPALAALARIERGSTLPADFDAVADRWDLPQRLHAELQRSGLGHLRPETPVAQLSGGQAMRVALVGAMLSDADFLILDEPSNHLDGPSRQALAESLRRWPRGLLVISHDRLLLADMARMVELSPTGLRSYGGGYGFYAQARAQAQQHAQARLEQRKLERQRAQHALQQQLARQQRRQARGQRQGQQANQAKIILDRQQQRAQDTAGKMLQRQAATRQALDEAVAQAAQGIAREAAITLHTPAAPAGGPRTVAELDAVVLPFGSDAFLGDACAQDRLAQDAPARDALTQHPSAQRTPASADAAHASRRISLHVRSGQRIGVTGPNGCGKTTLLRLLAGQLAPLAGHCRVQGRRAYLDQHLADLLPQHSVWAQMAERSPATPQDLQRTRLAQLGLDAARLSLPSGQLSGGERLKAALACALYADTPAQLLLLDEPGNQLDLPSLLALQAMLGQYTGTLVVASHDEAFLDSLKLTHRLSATAQGWVLQDLSPTIAG